MRRSAILQAEGTPPCEGSGREGGREGEVQPSSLPGSIFSEAFQHFKHFRPVIFTEAETPAKPPFAPRKALHGPPAVATADGTVRRPPGVWCALSGSPIYWTLEAGLPPCTRQVSLMFYRHLGQSGSWPPSLCSRQFSGGGGSLCPSAAAVWTLCVLLRDVVGLTANNKTPIYKKFHSSDLFSRFFLTVFFFSLSSLFSLPFFLYCPPITNRWPKTWHPQ